jgi:hypothetical protein
MSLWLPCGLHGSAVPNTVTVTVWLWRAVPLHTLRVLAYALSLLVMSDPMSGSLRGPD